MHSSTTPKAVILDMDGVLTRTTKIHASAWKQLFDEFLEFYTKKTASEYAPYQDPEDYKNHIDGIPRYDGVKRFLQSRNIILPEGSNTDDPGMDSVAALGNLKDDYFHQLLENKGVEVYKENIEAIRKWKNAGMPLAVISSSKNCEQVLNMAHISSLFDVRVDGKISEEKNLKGKPAPDIFEEAARQLNIKPSSIAVVEDSRLGVEAARNGGFACVIGFDEENGQQLLENGADKVVNSLLQASLFSSETTSGVQHALTHQDKIFSEFDTFKPALFFDYDGTLTPIVNNPDEALLDSSLRQKLSGLSKEVLCGVISGRDLEDVRKKVRIETLFYAGSHGYEISGPDNLHYEFPEAEEKLSDLDEITKELKRLFNASAGISVERKKYAIAIHYRNSDLDEETIKNKIEKSMRNKMGFKLSGGKKIIEVQPALEWNKGKALLWLMDKLGLEKETYLPVYIGDDVTDEDAFEALKSHGISIVVGLSGRTTKAKYYLENVAEVKLFISKLINYLRS